MALYLHYKMHVKILLVVERTLYVPWLDIWVNCSASHYTKVHHDEFNLKMSRSYNHNIFGQT